MSRWCHPEDAIIAVLIIGGLQRTKREVREIHCIDLYVESLLKISRLPILKDDGQSHWG